MVSLYDIFLQCTSVNTDSRFIESGSLFIALKGDHYDGNQYAKEALAKGAKYAVISDSAVKTDERFIVVPDTLKALQELAAWHRKKLTNTKVIVVGGSNGKTTTRNLIAAVLKQKYQVYVSQSNLNNHIGLPLSLLKVKPTDDYAVLEIAANNLGEHLFLCTLAQPDYGLITNFGKDHLQGYGTIEGVIQSNTEVYTYLHQNNGTVFINANDNIQVTHTKNQQQITYGTPETVAVSLDTLYPFVTAKVSSSKETAMIQSKLFGKFQIDNILSACAIGHHFGVSFAESKEAIERYNPDNNRSQLLNWKGNKVLLDAYNANPSSLLPMIEDVEGFEIENKIAIIGGMHELGTHTESEHLNLFNLLKQCVSFKAILLVGKVINETLEHLKIELPDHWHIFQNYQQVRDYLLSQELKDHFFFVKGSRYGLTLEKIFADCHYRID